MLLVIVLIGVLAVAGVAGLVLWIRRAASCNRRISAPAGESAAVFTGDVMCRYLMTSGSFARLEFFDWGIRVRGIAITRWIVPTWEARYSELARAELVAMHWSRLAIWLRVRGEAARIGFMTHYSRDILTRLEQHDVQVSRDITQVRRIAELYDRPS